MGQSLGRASVENMYLLGKGGVLEVQSSLCKKEGERGGGGKNKGYADDRKQYR